MQASTYLTYFAVALIYSWVAFNFWRNKAPSLLNLRWHSALIGLGLILHGSLLYQDIFIGDLNLNIANALSLIFG